MVHFRRIYNEHDVVVIGLWYDTDSRKGVYFLTGYRIQDHYNEFVQKMKTDETYQKLTKKISEERESVKSVSLSGKISHSSEIEKLFIESYFAETRKILAAEDVTPN